MSTSVDKRIFLPLLLLAAVVAGASPASAATSCSSADAPAAQSSAAKLSNAALCLVNQERSSRGLKPLKINRRLTLAATRHARDMVAHNYFSHTSLDGADFAQR